MDTWKQCRWCLFLLIVGLYASTMKASGTRPPIIWDPYHPLFECDDPIIYLKKHDKQAIICPSVILSRNSQAKTDQLYEKAVLLNYDQAEDYENCNSTVEKNLLASCQGGLYTDTDFFVDSFSSSPNKPFFEFGRTYYIIGTSFRTKDRLEDKIGGSCNTSDSSGANRLRLKVHICSNDEIENGLCNLCETEACMYKDCKKNCTEWVVKNQVQNEDSCYSIESRTCTNLLLQETKEELRETLSDCGKKCSGWSAMSYIKRGDSCFNLQTRKCNISFLQETSNEFRENVTDCLVEPTGVPSTGTNSSDADTYKYISIAVALVALIIGIVLGGMCHRHHHSKNCGNNNVQPFNKQHVKGSVNNGYDHTDSNIIMTEISTPEVREFVGGKIAYIT